MTSQRRLRSLGGRRHHVGANSTDSVRGCLMNCVTPAFMLPLMDQSGPTSAFLDSDLSADVRLTFSHAFLRARR